MSGMSAIAGEMRAPQTRLLGVAAAGVVAAMHIAPRGSWVYLIILAATLFAALYQSGWRLNQATRPTATGTALLGFGALALVSFVWAAVPAMSVRSGGAFLAETGLTIIAADCVARLPKSTVLSLGKGVMAGFAIGIVFIVFEGVTGLFLHRLVFNAFPGFRPGNDQDFSIEAGKVVGIGGYMLKRNTTEAALLLWPMLLMAPKLLPERHMTLAVLSVAGACTLAAYLSNHDSSFLAIAMSGGAFVLARVAFPSSWWTVATAWCAASLLVVPAMLWEFHARLYQLPWLQFSAQARLVIWGYSAEQVLKAPVLGIGAGSGGALFARQTSFDMAPGSRQALTTANHQHDIFLQTWYELGAVGAVALCLAGLVALWRLKRLPVSVRAYGLATFTAAMGMVSTSYGLWQEWFEASIAISAIALVIAIRLASPEAFELGAFRPVQD